MSRWRGDLRYFFPPKLNVFDKAKERETLLRVSAPTITGLMMKRVLSTEHDRVVLTEAGVSIDRELVPSSSPLAIDKEGRAAAPCIENHDPSQTLLLIKYVINNRRISDYVKGVT